MKNKLLIYLALFVIFSCKKEKTLEGIEHISMEEFSKQYNASNDVLLDVRTHEEYKEGFIKDAKLIEVKQQDKFIDEIESLDKNKTIYVYCRTGRRSQKASKILKEHGFNNVINIEGGIKKWEGDLNHP